MKLIFSLYTSPTPSQMVFRFFLRVDERSSDSYIGRDVFFSFFFGESFKIYLGSFFSLFDFWLLFKFSSFPLLKGRQTPLSNSESVQLRVWKVEFSSPIFSDIKALPIDPFSQNGQIGLILSKSVNHKLF